MLSPLQFISFPTPDGTLSILRFALLPLLLGVAARLVLAPALREARERTHAIVQSAATERKAPPETDMAHPAHQAS